MITYMYTYIHIHIYMCVYIYIERERDRYTHIQFTLFVSIYMLLPTRCFEDYVFRFAGCP